MTAKAVLLALLSFAIYSAHDVVIKLLGGRFSPFEVVFFSTLFAFPLVTLALIRDTQPGHLRPVNPGWTAVRTVASVVTTLSAFYAFSVLPLAQTYALLFATPLLITLLSIPVLGESVGWRRFLAVVVGLGGVLIVLRPGGTALSLGHFAALLSATGHAVASVILRRIGKDERPVVLLLYPLIANFLITGAMLPLVYTPPALDEVGLLAIIALLSFAGGLALIGAYKVGTAAMVAPMQYSQIVWALIFGYVIFKDRVDSPTVLGAAVIIVSGLYIVFRESRSGVSATTPVLKTRPRGVSPLSLRISMFFRR